jgi:hypothetical protein
VKRIHAVLVAVLLPAVLAGCTTTAAYRRGRLAKPKMQLEPDPNAALVEQHVYEYREGSAGGYGGGGGGCGCN